MSAKEEKNNRDRASSERSLGLLKRNTSGAYTDYGTNEPDTDLENQLADIAASIKRFKGQAPLGCCFTISPLRNAAEYGALACFALAAIGLIVAGVLTENDILLWCGLGSTVALGITAFILAAHKQRMIPLLDDHKNMGNLLDFLYSSYITLQETVNTLRTTVARLGDQISRLNIEVTGLKELKDELEERARRLEIINNTLTISTTNLTQIIQEGGEDVKELIAEAKKGQGAFWDACLKLSEIKNQLQATSQAFAELEEKLRDTVDNVLDYPEMRDFHERIEQLTPLFPGILASAGKTHISDEEARTLTEFINTIKDALAELRNQDEKVTLMLSQTKRELQVCLDTHCSPRTDESKADGGGAPAASP